MGELVIVKSFLCDLKTQRENLVSQLKIHTENRMKVAERQKKYDNNLTATSALTTSQNSNAANNAQQLPQSASKPKTDGVWA